MSWHTNTTGGSTDRPLPDNCRPTRGVPVSACEECWTEASARSFRRGTSVVDEYRKLIRDSKHHETVRPEPPADDGAGLFDL